MKKAMPLGIAFLYFSARFLKESVEIAERSLQKNLFEGFLVLFFKKERESQKERENPPHVVALPL